MKTTTSIRIVTAALVMAGSLVPVALAGGEPKNDAPFTRPVGDRTTASAQVQAAEQVVGVGEAKNQLPFTRPVVDGKSALAQSVARGEAKNDLPFTQVVESPAGSGSGFDWGDAGIGVGAGLGIAAMVAGGLLLAYRGPRGRRIGAAATR
jgi:hypothetical protein